VYTVLAHIHPSTPSSSPWYQSPPTPGKTFHKDILKKTVRTNLTPELWLYITKADSNIQQEGKHFQVPQINMIWDFHVDVNEWS
jgi:hypothetical protein